MEIDVHKIDGAPAGKPVALPNDVFDIKPNDHLIYQAVRSQMTNSRQGTASTKNRAMVRGGGRKPWRQKGRGVCPFLQEGLFLPKGFVPLPIHFYSALKGDQLVDQGGDRR